MTASSNVVGTAPSVILMTREEVITVKKAAHLVGRSEKTIRAWARRFGIGRQVAGGGTIEVSHLGLLMVIHGDPVALEDLRAGRRDSASVRRFREFLGISG